MSHGEVSRDLCSDDRIDRTLFPEGTASVMITGSSMLQDPGTVYRFYWEHQLPPPLSYTHYQCIFGRMIGLPSDRKIFMRGQENAEALQEKGLDVIYIHLGQDGPMHRYGRSDLSDPRVREALAEAKRFYEGNPGPMARNDHRINRIVVGSSVFNGSLRPDDFPLTGALITEQVIQTVTKAVKNRPAATHLPILWIEDGVPDEIVSMIEEFGGNSPFYSKVKYAADMKAD